MSLLDNQTKINANTSFFAPAASGGGGGGGAGTFTSTVTIGPNASSTSQIVVYGDADEKVKIVATNATAVIQHTNAAGTNDTPYIGFGNGNLNIRDPSDNLMINFSSIAQGVDFRMGINMSNNTISLDQNKLAGLYYNAGDANVYLTGVSTHQINIGTQSNTTQLTVEDNQVIVSGNLAVSSINNLKPVLNWSTIGFNSNFPAGAGTVPIGGVPYAITDSFVVDPTHKYRVSLEAGYSNNDATGSYTAIYLSGTSPTVYLTTINNSNAIPAQNDARGGCSAIFAPTLSNIQLVAANSSAISATGIQVNVAAGVVVEDLGLQ